MKQCKTLDIKGFQEVSLLEWEGKLASIIFLGQCNMRCPFCHAGPLVLDSEKMDTIPFEKIEEFLKRKKGWIDLVVISGGEPTLYDELPDLADRIKSMGFCVMIETNGTRPDIIEKLIENKRLDCVAMDIKTLLGDSGRHYKSITASDVDVEKIKQSIAIIMSSGIDYEFRTTVVPGILQTWHIEEIARYIKGAKKWALQQFSPQSTLNPAYRRLKPYPKKKLQEMAAIAREHVDIVVIRNE